MLLLGLTFLVNLNVYAWTPDRPLKFIVPNVGGPASLSAISRIVKNDLDILKIPTTVIFRGGLERILGTNDIAEADPDGYTFGITTQDTLEWNRIPEAKHFNDKTFYKIATVADWHYVLVSSNNAHKKQKDLMIAGSPNYIEKLSSSTGISLLQIPYKAVTPALMDLSENRIDLVLTSYSAVIGFVNDGRIKLIAVTSPKRLEYLPQTPTLSESHPGLVISNSAHIIIRNDVSKDVKTFYTKLFKKVAKSTEACIQIKKVWLEPRTKCATNSVDLNR